MGKIKLGIGVSILLLVSGQVSAALIYNSDGFFGAATCNNICSGSVSDLTTNSTNGGNAETAADFILSNRAILTGLSWVGSTLPDPRDFTIRIYSEISGAPKKDPFYEYNVGSAYQTFDLPGIPTLYNADISPRFLPMDKTFFLSIQANSGNDSHPDSWGWSTDNNSFQDDRFFRDDRFGGDWAPKGIGRIEAFQLFGKILPSRVPEPSIMALFAAGLFGIGLARRSKAADL